MLTLDKTKNISGHPNTRTELPPFQHFQSLPHLAPTEQLIINSASADQLGPRKWHYNQVPVHPPVPANAKLKNSVLSLILHLKQYETLWVV